MPAGKAGKVGRPADNEWNALREELSAMHVDDLLIWKPTNGKSVKTAQKTALLHILTLPGTFRCLAEYRRAGNQRAYLDKLYVIRLK